MVRIWSVLAHICLVTLLAGGILKCAPQNDREAPSKAATGVLGFLPESPNDQDIGRSALHFPLSTAGRYIVDTQGNRFKLKAVNWYGSHLERQVPEGLDKQHMDHIVALIKKWGFNTVRLPFSNQMLHDQNPVPTQLLAANPTLQGMTPLEVFDHTVQALADQGIAIILNNHTTFSEHCCAFDSNGLWFYSGSRSMQQTYENWRDDWLFLLRRYRHVAAIVGADLRNEVRTTKFQETILPIMPQWGGGGANDWHYAAESLGRDINRLFPSLIVVVEGINWTGMIRTLGSGERPHLKPVRDQPIHLLRPDKLVYAAHNYAYIGPYHNGDPQTSPGQITYADLPRDRLAATIEEEWGYILTHSQHFTSPVWVSEFGASRTTTSPKDRAWFFHMTQEIIDRDLDFAYWPLNPDDYGLVTADWQDIAADDWRYEPIKMLLASSGNPSPMNRPLWHSLDIRSRDDDQSGLGIDWLAAARKGACAPGYRLVGLSRDNRALCSNQGRAYHGEDSGDFQVEAVRESPRSPQDSSADWAYQRTKYECPMGSYAAGFTRHHWGTSGLLCFASKKPLSNRCHTQWFDRGEDRMSYSGGDFAMGALKGQCRDDEYIKGLAQIDGTASAILCCAMSPAQ